VHALAADERREAALSTYMQQMSDLMLKGGTSRNVSSVHQVMRTSTLTTLRQLDGERKGLVIQFLAEAGLIDYQAGGPYSPEPTVSLVGADLRQISFNGPLYNTMNFVRADLRDAHFRGADITATFESADLRGADFSGATFTDARFSKACLARAQFVGADLGKVAFDGAAGYDIDFSHADLRHADMRSALLVGVTLDDARLPKGWVAPQGGTTTRKIDALCRKRLSHL